MSATDSQFNVSASPSSTERREGGGGKEDEREDNIIEGESRSIPETNPSPTVKETNMEQPVISESADEVNQSTSEHMMEIRGGGEETVHQDNIMDDESVVTISRDVSKTPPQLVLVSSPPRLHDNEDDPPSSVTEGNDTSPTHSLSLPTHPSSVPPTQSDLLPNHSTDDPVVAMETDRAQFGGGVVLKPAPPLSEQESSDESDEEAIDLEIVIEGEEDEDEDVVVMETTSDKTASATPVTSQSSITVATSGPASSSGGEGRQGGKRLKECAKVKQFFTTLQKFANNISHDVAEQVQELITALVNGLATVEEFHQEIQMVTNYPLKEFVIPFLKENLIYFQEELKDTKQILSNILGSAPQPGGPPTAPQHAEPELVIVPSTKPSAPPTTNTVISVAPPTSPLKASANLVSMSAPPATIHEPPNIPPTRIETIPNITAANLSSSRKRPRDLFMEGEDGRQVYTTKRVPRPIPTATLTPTSTHDQQHQHQQQQQVVEPHPSRVTPPTSSTPSSIPTSHTRPSPTVSVETPPLREVSPSLTVANHQRLLNLIKDDWNCLDLMMTTLEGMVSKTQRSLMTLKERIHLVSSLSSAHNLYKQFEQEQEPIILQRIQQAVDDVKTKASEEKQKVLMDASRQLREALKEANVQSSSKENCWNCGRKATETCSGCSKARYCGTYCQHKDWDRHVKHCATSSSSSSSSGGSNTPSAGVMGGAGGGVAISNRSGNREHITMSRHHSNRTTPLSHTHVPTPNHHMSNTHSLITVASTNPRLVKPTRATPIATPTTYIAGGSELLVPLHPDPLVNGALTGTSNGVAVVTINRSAGDLTGGGGLL